MSLYVRHDIIPPYLWCGRCLYELAVPSRSLTAFHIMACLPHTVWTLATSAYLSALAQEVWALPAFLAPIEPSLQSFLWNPPLPLLFCECFIQLPPAVPCTNRLVAIVSIVATPASRSCCLPDQRVCACHQTISCSRCCPSRSLSCDYLAPLPCFIFLLTASAICHYSSLFVSFLYYKTVSLRAMLVTRGHC